MIYFESIVKTKIRQILAAENPHQSLTNGTVFCNLNWAFLIQFKKLHGCIIQMRKVVDVHSD